MDLFTVKDVTFSYAGSSAPALNNVSCAIAQGEFVVIAGESGCGKSTLLKLMKKQLTPKGELSGEVRYCGERVCEVSDRIMASEVGFVMQNPDEQIVTDKVWSELAFGLENIGKDSESIRRKVAETASFFGINSWYHRHTYELSGGQKQLLNLASIMAMSPKVLLLDEPTSQLDAISATEFINMLKRVNTEFGMTVVVVEHRLEELLPIADKVIYLGVEGVIASGEPSQVCERILASGEDRWISTLPSAVRLYAKLGGDSLPITVKQGKDYIAKYDEKYTTFAVRPESEEEIGEVAVECKDLCFRYDKKGEDVLRGVKMSARMGEIYAILGGNGAGKSTLLKNMSGLVKPYRGSVRVAGKKLSEYKGGSLYRGNLTMLPQNSQALFVENSVREDLVQICKVLDYEGAESEQNIKSISEYLGVEGLLERNPHDLSGGELQKVALAKLLLTKPKIILLDEPTKGLDSHAKKLLGEILIKLKAAGKCVVVVSHDIEFCAEYADRCAMFFDGQIISVGNPVDFFGANAYYTTASARIARGKYTGAVTVDMLAEICAKNGVSNG